jgi:hypothetical protein
LFHVVIGLPPAQWGLVGRWVAWMPRGVFIHRPITATPQVHSEKAIGWIFHHAVGIVYAAQFGDHAVRAWLGTDHRLSADLRDRIASGPVAGARPATR